MGIFHSKHQKLILQCYPAGKDVDKKPNPSELSYLLYYASTRRIKLEKVAVFLERKTSLDSSRSRYGNLKVTLQIVLSLINKCGDNLNVFANQVCAILHLVLKTKDLTLCRLLVGVYETFCSRLDGALFSGDRQFVDAFTLLSQDLINTSSLLGAQQGGLHHREWKMMALMACRHVFSCLVYSLKLTRKFIGLGLPLLTSIIHANNTEQNLMVRVNNAVNVENSKLLANPVLHRVTSGKSTAMVERKIDEDFESDSVTVSDLNEEAFRALKVLFNTTLTNQIAEASKGVVSVNKTSDYNQNWGSAFLQLCTTYIPVQLRFSVLSTLLAKATHLSLDKEAYHVQLLYANYILGLVSSSVNMIGLSISDIIQQLLHIQLNLFLSAHSAFSKEEIESLSQTYSNSICNLSSHIYYFDQVPDSIQEILIKIDSILGAPYSDATSENIASLVLTLLDDIARILTLLGEKPATISRNHATLENWTISLPLLSPKTEFSDSEFTCPLSDDQISEIQLRYLKLFRNFILTEMMSSDEKLSSREFISTENISFNLQTFLKPNHNDYISSEENFISHFLHYVNKLLSTPSVNTVVVKSLIELVKDLGNILGINFLSNFVPFFYHWQLPASKQEIDDNLKVKNTFAYIIMFQLMSKFDIQYPEQLGNYTKDSTFYSGIISDIEYRKLNGLWVDELDDIEVSKIEPKSSNSDQVPFESNKKALLAFVAGLAFTARWINPQRSLSLDLARQKAPERSNHYDFSLNDLSEFSSDEDETETDISTRLPNSGLGLGNAHDIVSIQSGLLQSQHSATKLQAHINPNVTIGSDVTGSSLFTQDHSKYYVSPKVSDLKEIITENKDLLRKPSAKYMNGNGHLSANTINGHVNGSGHESRRDVSTPGSVLSKQMTSTDVDSILGGLDSDDENEFVV